MGALDCVSSKITPTQSTEVFTKRNSDLSLDVPRRDVESQQLTFETRSKKHSIWWRLAFDIPLLLIVVVVILLYEFGVIPQRKNGFFCNDPTLSHVYNGEIITSTILLSTVLLLPIAVIIPTELIMTDSSCSFKSKFKESTMKTLWLYRCYAYGLFFNLGLVEVMKGLVGNPRPTFFYICEPDTAKTCVGSEFVSTFNCTSTKFSRWQQMDSYRSFPSGHTSLSVYCGLFIAWYLQRRAFDWRHRTIFLVPVVQLLCLTYAAICSLTRITDHRHHWWDVLTGAGIGIACLFHVVLVLCNNFTRSSSLTETEIMQSQQTVKSELFDVPQSPVT